MIVWLASYPRSGNSLFANLAHHHLDIPIYSIYNETDLDIYIYLDKDQLQAASESGEIYLVKTHELPEDNFPAVYLIRDGRDVVISYAHYIIDKKINIPTPPPDNLLQWALDALVNSTDQFGGWSAHTSAWTERAGNVTIIRYEDLIQRDKQLGILKLALSDLGITNLLIVNKSSIQDFSKYHNEMRYFYRKGKAGAWITEMPSNYHLNFWEQHGGAMQKLGYKKDQDQNIVRTEFIISEVARNFENKMESLEHTYQQLTTEFLETRNRLNQSQTQLKVMEENRHQELTAQNGIITSLSQQLELKTEQMHIQKIKWEEQTALLLYKIEEQNTYLIAKDQRLINQEQELSAKGQEIIIKDQRLINHEQELTAKQQEIIIKDQRLINQEQELVAKEQVIQKFRNSLSYILLHGPFRYLPIITKTQQAMEQWLIHLKSKWRYYFMPRLGVLYQFPPKPCDIPASYFKVKHLIQPAPTISIVTPTYNYAHFLERTMKSVIYQGYPELEYIVQDGGSSDNTIEIVKKFKHHIKHFESKKDNGQSHAINLGFQQATGEIMAYLNSDDILLPGTLDYIANFFSIHPKVDVVYGHRLTINEDDQVVGEWIMPPHNEEAMRWADYIPQETLFWRRSIWEKVGGQADESLQFAMDWDLLLRFQEAGAVFERLPRFLAAFRVHTQQKTSAQISDLGEKDVAFLRQRNFGREVGREEIKYNIHAFLQSSILHHWLYKLKLKTHKLLGIFHNNEKEALSWYDPESIYFYSLHKAGTALFTHILRQSNELIHVDYETQLFDDTLPGKFSYKKNNHIYGVFRIQEKNKSKIYSKITRRIIKNKFVNNKTIIFLIRDPRDILVSLYYSMGKSHVTSKNSQVASEFLIFRKNMSTLSLDEYVIRDLPKVMQRLETLYTISKSCKHSLILKYEDLINNFDNFMMDFNKYISIPEEIKQELYRASRPRDIEDPLAHKRSGKIGQYKEKLKPETIHKLNKTLKPVLEKFGYKE